MTTTSATSAILGALLLVACGPQNPGSASSTGSDDVPRPSFKAYVSAPVEDAAQRPLGVVFLMIDTLRADHVGAYGDLGLTPNLDALFEDSVVFENATATSSWTRPSVATMMTGLYPSSMNVLRQVDVLTPDHLTYPEILRSHGGYATLAVSTNHQSGVAFGFNQGYDDFIVPTELQVHEEDGSQAFSAETVVRVGREWLTDHIGTNGRTPFFMFLHFMDPHSPYMPHPEFQTEPEPKGRFSGCGAALRKMDALPYEELTELDKERIRYLYRGEVRFCDHWIGEFLKGLLAADLYEDTLIIVTSDHGEELWDHGKRDHGRNLYQEVLHVPLAIKLPKSARRGTRVSTPVSLIDLAPTLLELCNFRVPGSIQGTSLVPLIEGKTRDVAHEYRYSELPTFESMEGRGFKIIRDRAHTMATADDHYETYDLRNDPHEREDLNGSQDANHVRMEAHLKEALFRWVAVIRGHERKATTIELEELDRETLDHLMGMGYLGHDQHRKILEKKSRAGSVLLPKDLKGHLGASADGWIAPRFQIDVSTPKKAGTVTVHGTLPEGAPWSGGNRVEVRAQGKAIGSFELEPGGVREVTFPLDIEALAISGERMTLEFESRKTFEIADDEEPTTKRKVAFQLLRLEVR